MKDRDRESVRWWWLRHAPVIGHEGVIYGCSDVPCDTSDLARFQALAATLPRDGLWLTSGLSRTMATAKAIGAAGGFVPEPEVESDLKEQCFGDWQGMRWDDISDAADFWESPGENRPPGGESFADVMSRVGATVARINACHQGRDVVAVAHGGTIRAALAVALDIRPDRALGIKVSTLSLTRIDRVGGGWRVAGVNLECRVS